MGEKRDIVNAPDGFDWNKYPEAIELGGESFAYVGTSEGTPHYRLGK